MKNRSLTILIVAIILLILFCNYTPINLFNSFGLWLVLIQSFISAILLSMAILGARNIIDLYNIIDYMVTLKNRLIVAFIPVILLITCGLILYIYQNNRLDYAYEKNSIVTKGIVIDGSGKTLSSIRKSVTNYSLKINYIDNKGTSHILSSLVSKDFFETLAIGQIIELKYLTQYPEVFRIIENNQNNEVKTGNFIGRYLSFTDLEKLSAINEKDYEVYLNSISFGWRILNDSLKLVFKNSESKEIVIKYPNDEILLESQILHNPMSFIPNERIAEIIHPKNNKNSDSMIITKYKLNDRDVLHMFISKNNTKENKIILRKSHF